MIYKDIAAEALPELRRHLPRPREPTRPRSACSTAPAGPSAAPRSCSGTTTPIGAERELVGLRGSPTRVKEIESVVLAQSEARMVEPDEAGIAELVHELIEEHILG